MQNLDYTREFISINIAVLTVSDSRTLANDKSGDYLEKNIIASGHVCIKREIIKDDVSLAYKAWILE